MEKINLYRMRRMMRATEKITWRLEREKSKAERTTSCRTGMPGNRRNYSRVEEGAIRICELEDAFLDTVQALDRMRKELAPCIDALENPDDRAVMRLRYMKGFGAEQIAEGMYMTDRMVYYILARSEKQLAGRYPDRITEGR